MTDDAQAGPTVVRVRAWRSHIDDTLEASEVSTVAGEPALLIVCATEQEQQRWQARIEQWQALNRLAGTAPATQAQEPAK